MSFFFNSKDFQIFNSIGRNNTSVHKKLVGSDKIASNIINISILEIFLLFLIFIRINSAGNNIKKCRTQELAIISKLSIGKNIKLKLIIILKIILEMKFSKFL